VLLFKRCPNDLNRVLRPAYRANDGILDVEKRPTTVNKIMYGILQLFGVSPMLVVPQLRYDAPSFPFVRGNRG